MLKQARNAVISGNRVQTAIRKATRRRLLPAAAYRRLPPIGPHPMTTPAGNRFIYVGHPDDMMARTVVWDDLANWEASSLREFSRLAANSELFLDVGAYAGIYSLIACTDGPGQAIAFEPNPDTRPLLAANIAANGLGHRIAVIPKGVADREGTAQMVVPDDRTAARIDVDGMGPTVELTTIDRVLEGRRVDVIKVDVEGLEPQVILGGRESIEMYRPALILEVLDREAFGRLTRVLEPLGYRSCVHLGPEGARKVDGFVNTPGHANFLWT